jgi:hypothetical protein
LLGFFDSNWGLAFLPLALIFSYYAVKEEKKEMQNGIPDEKDKGQVEA